MKLKDLKKWVNSLTNEQLEQDLLYNSEEYSISGKVHKIEKAKQDLDNLQNSPAALEKFARERYLMKKDGEDIFIIEDSIAVKN